MASGRRDVQRSAIRGKSLASVARPVRMFYGQAVQLLQKEIGDRKLVADEKLPPPREFSASPSAVAHHFDR